MSNIAGIGERVDEFRASAFAVSQQARDIAPVDAAASDKKVVARAPRDAAQLKFALRGRGIFAKPHASERQSRVTLNARARREQSVTLGLAFQPASFHEQVLDGADGVNRRALYVFDTLLVGGSALVNRLRFVGTRLRTFEKKHQRRQRPRERGGGAISECMRAAHALSVPREEPRHAEGRCRREVDDGEFTQKHGEQQKGNAHASFDSL